MAGAFPRRVVEHVARLDREQLERYFVNAVRDSQLMRRMLDTMMGQQELPQQILAAPVIALIEEQQHPRRANCLAWVQHQVRAVQPRLHPHLAGGIGGDLNRPFPAPTHRGDEPGIGAREIKERQYLAG